MEITPRQLEIIEATGKILTTSGVSRLTIKNLAKEMQFSESAIYRHFESKEEILLMMLQYLRYNITLIKSSLSKTDDVEKDFCMFFQKLSKFFNANPYFAVAVFSEGLLDENEKLNKEIMGISVSLCMDSIRRIIEREPFFSDQRICEELLKEDIFCSRRTVAKYRNQMHIPSVSRRIKQTDQ